MNPLFRIDFSISDSLKIVRKSVLIYETIIVRHGRAFCTFVKHGGQFFAYVAQYGKEVVYSVKFLHFYGSPVRPRVYLYAEYDFRLFASIAESKPAPLYASTAAPPFIISATAA